MIKVFGLESLWMWIKVWFLVFGFWVLMVVGLWASWSILFNGNQNKPKDSISWLCRSLQTKSKPQSMTWSGQEIRCGWKGGCDMVVVVVTVSPTCAWPWGELCSNLWTLCVLPAMPCCDWLSWSDKEQAGAEAVPSSCRECAHIKWSTFAQFWPPPPCVSR